MNEGKQPAARLRRHQPLEAGEVIRTRVSRADVSGRAGKRHQFVGRNADRGAVGINVRVQIDEAWRDELAFGVDGLCFALTIVAVLATGSGSPCTIGAGTAGFPGKIVSGLFLQF